MTFVENFAKLCETLREIDNQKFHARFKIKFLKKSGISQKS